MEEIYKTYEHNPPHLFRPKAKYFITGSTYEKRPYLMSDEAKIKTLEYMFKSFAHFGWQIEDWVMLNNHYHLMAQAPEDATTLSQVINNFHKFSAIWLKKHVSVLPAPKKIWHNYWDTCITHENSYFARINYIWHNPVRHKYVEDAATWRFGSFYYRTEQGDDVKSIIEKYPWDKVQVYDDF